MTIDPQWGRQSSGDGGEVSQARATGLSGTLPKSEKDNFSPTLFLEGHSQALDGPTQFFDGPIGSGLGSLDPEMVSYVYLTE